MADDHPAALVPCIFVRPPDMTDEEAEEWASYLHAVPRRFILGAAT